MSVIADSLRYLEVRVTELEKDLKESSAELRAEAKKSFKVLSGLFLLEAIPTLQALGLPMKDVLPAAAKLILGFIHF